MLSEGQFEGQPFELQPSQAFIVGSLFGWKRKDARTYLEDGIPWCGLFMAVVAKRGGKPIVEGPLWARNWAKFGKAADKAQLGDVLVFRRGQALGGSG